MTSVFLTPIDLGKGEIPLQHVIGGPEGGGDV